jgi:hypothetical protein
MELKQAQNAGEIRLSLELVTGTIGDSDPGQVVQSMVDALVKHLNTTDPGQLWKITKADGVYKAWKGDQTARYSPPHLDQKVSG